MPNDFYYHLTPVECFPYLGTWLRWLQQCLYVWVMGRGGGGVILIKAGILCMHGCPCATCGVV